MPSLTLVSRAILPHGVRTVVTRGGIGYYHFYHDLLWLTNVGVSEATTGTMHRLRFGTSDIKLIDPTHRPGASPIGIDQQLGLRYLTFVVTNLDEVIQRLQAAHIAFTRPKTTIRPGTTIAMVKDPDGNIVEFVERG